MRNKSLSWISLGVSCISLIVSIAVLVNYCPTQNLQFDYMGVIVGILALLVTSLIGAQVGQYIFVDKKIEGISSKITRTIARKVAQEEARIVAQKTAERIAEETANNTALGIVGGLPDDIMVILKGKDLMKNASQEALFSEKMKAIDYSIQALEYFKKCQSETLYKSTVDDTLIQIKGYFEYCKNDGGGVRILKDKRTFYESVLNDLRSDHLPEIQNYLAQAEGKEEEFDNELSNQRVKDAIDELT